MSEHLSVTLSQKSSILCKNVFGRSACLNLLEESGACYLELTYRGKSAKVRLAEGETEILSVYGVSFRLKVSDVLVRGGTVSARLRLTANAFGQTLTLIDEKVSIRVPKRESGTLGDDRQPGLMPDGVEDAPVWFGDEAIPPMTEGNAEMASPGEAESTTAGQWRCILKYNSECSTGAGAHEYGYGSTEAEARSNLDRNWRNNPANNGTQRVCSVNCQKIG